MLYTLKDHKNGVKNFKTQVEPSFKHSTEYEMIDSQTGKKNHVDYNHLISKKRKQKTIALDTFKNSSTLFCRITYWLRYKCIHVLCKLQETSSFLTAKSKPIKV